MRLYISPEVTTVLCTIAVAAAATIILVGEKFASADVKKECHKAQQAAYAASAPKVPECK